MHCDNGGDATLKRAPPCPRLLGTASSAPYCPVRPLDSSRAPAVSSLILQKDLLVPTVEGMLIVLHVAKDSWGLHRVVVTSSVSVVVPAWDGLPVSS